MSLTNGALDCNFQLDTDMEFYSKAMCCSKRGLNAPPGSDGMLCCDAPAEGGCADDLGDFYPYEHCCMFDRCV